MPSLTPQQAIALAHDHRRAQRFREAEQLYRQVLVVEPENADAFHYLGVIALYHGQSQAGVELIRRAVVLRPNDGHAHDNLATALHAAGQSAQALVAHERAAALLPNSAGTQFNYGLGLQIAGRFEEAVACFQRSLAINPAHTDAYNNLSHCLCTIGQVEQAINAANGAIRCSPNDIRGHGNLGNSLLAAGQVDQAIQAYRRAITLGANGADPRLSLAIALLLKGDLVQGWEEYEWRWKSDEFTAMRHDFTQPHWDGSPLNGRSLLIHAEQGLGDAILFSRYLPLLAEKIGADAQQKIILEIQYELERLFQPFAKQCTIVVRGQPLPPFDLQCSLLSLPGIFKTSLETVPTPSAYLFADPDLIETWREKLGSNTAEKKVALTWAGNPTFKADRKRSLSLDRLAPLAAVKDVKFYSVQKGYAQQQLAKPPDGLQVIDLSADLHDFADTAAVLSLMDLVITTDTSVAHLAGALGRPVWLMLQHVPYFIWLRERKDSPWYASMRLFRQPTRGDWASVIKQVADALQAIP